MRQLDLSSSTILSSIVYCLLLLYRRKVIQYIHGCDSGIDEVDGHGTHVSSIAVGSIDGGDIFDGSISEYSGVAPGAKMAMFDLGTDTNLCIPDITGLLSGAQQAGAKVFSYSWDSSAVSNYQTADIDLYLFMNQVGSTAYHHTVDAPPHHPNTVPHRLFKDITVLFAAGNTGQQGAHSICLQSSAKNIVSVGSGDIEAMGSSQRRVAYYSAQGPTYDGR